MIAQLMPPHYPSEATDSAFISKVSTKYLLKAFYPLCEYLTRPKEVHGRSVL